MIRGRRAARRAPGAGVSRASASGNRVLAVHRHAPARCRPQRALVGGVAKRCVSRTRTRVPAGRLGSQSPVPKSADPTAAGPGRGRSEMVRAARSSRSPRGRCPQRATVSWARRCRGGRCANVSYAQVDGQLLGASTVGSGSISPVRHLQELTPAPLPTSLGAACSANGCSREWGPVRPRVSTVCFTSHPVVASVGFRARGSQVMAAS